jgi:hypothetical protein
MRRCGRDGRGLDAGHVGGEEADAVAVKVAAVAVVVLGRSGVGVPGKDLGIAERNAGVEGGGDGCVSQRVLTDVTGMSAAFAIWITIR